MTNEDSTELLRQALENICSEANEAARLASIVLAPDNASTFRRELARIMEIVDGKLIPRMPTSP